MIISYPQGIRPDGRSSLTSFRPVSISPNSITTAEGSAIVKQGETIISCGIKAEIAKPRTETPNEGMCNIIKSGLRNFYSYQI